MKRTSNSNGGCRTFYRLAGNGNTNNGMRITRKYPLANWGQVWQNLHATPTTEDIKSMWYRAVHDIFPTNVRLATIHLKDTTNCATCGHTDTLQHRITECEEGPVCWTRTKKILGYILRDDPRHIPQEWITQPAFRHWPPRKQAAVLWFWHTSCFIAYRGNGASPLRIIWTSCKGLGGSYTATRDGHWLLGSIWKFWNGLRTDMPTNVTGRNDWQRS
jgi:hypothetical protein